MSTTQLLRPAPTSRPSQPKLRTERTGRTRTTRHASPSAPRSEAAPREAGEGERDRFIDVLRAGAVLTVVALHWLMPTLSYDDGRLSTGNALAAPGAWIITWVAQVMPLVFFAGGAAAAMAISRHLKAAESPSTWVAHRLVRLAWPVVPLAAVWLPLPFLLDAAGVPTQPLELGTRLIGQLLWFLVVYVICVAMTPVLVRIHCRCHGWEIAALAVVAVVVDVTRFVPLHGNTTLGYLNIVFVWMTIYQMGVAYGGGRWKRIARTPALVVAAMGFGVTAAAVAAGPYASSMIGMPGAPMSNMDPPTAVLISLAIGQLGLLFAVKPEIERWAAQREPARACTVLSDRMMTIYLWHVPVFVVGAGVAVVGFGIDTPPAFGREWREVMPISLVAAGVVLAGVVALMGRFERPPRWLRPRTPDPAIVEVAAVLIGLGLLALTIAGFRHTAAPTPAGAVVAIGVGLALMMDGSKFRTRGSGRGAAAQLRSVILRRDDLRPIPDPGEIRRAA